MTVPFWLYLLGCLCIGWCFGGIVFKLFEHFR